MNTPPFASSLRSPQLDVVPDTKDIRLRGPEADVVEAVASVEAFLENNYTVNYEVAEEDKSVLLQGGGER